MCDSVPTKSQTGIDTDEELQLQFRATNPLTLEIASRLRELNTGVLLLPESPEIVAEREFYENTCPISDETKGALVRIFRDIIEANPESHPLMFSVSQSNDREVTFRYRRVRLGEVAPSSQSTEPETEKPEHTGNRSKERNAMEIEDYLTVIGCEVTDKVSGYKGVAMLVQFDLYGCIQVLVTNGHVSAEKETLDFFDYNRLEIGTPILPPTVTYAFDDVIVRPQLMIEQYMGRRGKCLIMGCAGVVDAVVFELGGRIRLSVTPESEDDGMETFPSSRIIEVVRFKLDRDDDNIYELKDPVMPCPNFTLAYNGEEKPPTGASQKDVTQY